MALDEKHYIGCCGLYCGMCPRFQSTAPSRCPGCHLGEQHSYCSVYRCCVERHGHHTCADCAEFPCERLERVLGVGLEADSFISHRPAMPNLERIREVGLEAFLEEQKERRLLVETLLARYNEGRSMSFYCVAGALLPPQLIGEAIAELERGQTPAKDADLKAKAKSMKAALQERAGRAGIDLKLRRKPS
jgi:hypothetical protein